MLVTRIVDLVNTNLPFQYGENRRSLILSNAVLRYDLERPISDLDVDL